MKKTHKYTTLKGLLNKTNQYSLNTFTSKQMYHLKNGWVNVKLSNGLKQEIIHKFNCFLKRNVEDLERSYGIFERLIINKRTFEVSYIAGQDYTSELRTIRGLIK